MDLRPILLNRHDVARVYTATSHAAGRGLDFDDATPDQQRIALLMASLINHVRATGAVIDGEHAVQIAAATMDAAFRIGYAPQPWLADDDGDGRIVRGAVVRTEAEKTYCLLAEALIACDLTQCGCGARIRWVRTEAGKPMPLDEAPHPDGNVVPTGVGDTVRVLNGSQLPHDGAAWRSHFVTCPEAADYRRTRARHRPAPPPAPSCTVCRQPLDVDLVIETGATTHPACDPTGDPAPTADTTTTTTSSDEPPPLFDLRTA